MLTRQQLIDGNITETVVRDLMRDSEKRLAWLDSRGIAYLNPREKEKRELIIRHIHDYHEYLAMIK